MAGFWVQRIGTPMRSAAEQMLQPMHSRMSSIRPSRSSGQEGVGDRGARRADEVETPSRTCRTMVSGDVKRPVLTTGFSVTCLTQRTYSSSAPSFTIAGAADLDLVVAGVDVPEVRHLGQHLEGTARFSSLSDSSS